MVALTREPRCRVYFFATFKTFSTSPPPHHNLAPHHDGYATPYGDTLKDVVNLENAKDNPLIPGSARSVVIVTAGTASGKSTQLTQRIMYLELDKGLQVACTQPRRVAARRVSERVAAEMDVRLSEQVGIHHRDHNNTNEKTRLKFVTEGILLRQYQEDPTLSRYSCVIVHECHERTADADILLALLKKTLVNRPELKLVIMSATMNTQEFADYFGQQIQVTVSKLHKGIKDLDVVPLYSSLPQDEQVKAFHSGDKRICIVATNIAETSLTIEGVACVVGMTTLLPAPISQASAEQRAGRANRTRLGVCFRLYTKETFDNTFLKSSPPGIHKADIKKYILILKSAGYNAVGTFDFLEPPHPEVYLRGLQDLKAMNMIHNNGNITPAGNGSLELPIEQAWYNAFVRGLKLGCLDEIISIAAFSSTRHSIFAKPYPQRYAAATEHAQFTNPVSDHMTELNAFYKWRHQCKLGAKEAAVWCHETLLNVEALNEAFKFRKEMLDECGVLFGIESVPALTFDDEEYDIKIRKAIARQTLV
ncbi:Pre-mRNA-splicing factor ATP-dependent RNA helicase PRP43 [Fusarium oxysporum f. sp. cubense race 1]|uniref:Pre-mRNA-splicing factor ATP-dependent RNA helicase PRP43 n=1 Tax=Fusarium oxysporum f. sp. cubense (strain race 1) TaxID=1229664 RepID=N4U376_FUSC1|nr:Pre-mRNA-splicing factor ATP-dependent RNA helicase PRP43 [Fusarium oxysporum f. sp. cubense race 1]